MTDSREEQQFPAHYSAIKETLNQSVLVGSVSYCHHPSLCFSENPALPAYSCIILYVAEVFNSAIKLHKTSILLMLN